MRDNCFEKDKAEITKDKLMAFTLAKLAPFEQARHEMFHEDNIYNSPPIFVWRFSAEVEGLDDLCSKLGKCIESFKGNLNWIMYRGARSDGRSLKNYVIEPKFLLEVAKLYGWGAERSKVLESDYKVQVAKAVADVEPLCEHIEKTFNISNSKPYPSILPADMRNVTNSKKVQN